jgi:tRNA (cytidine/uridine-2'-O-)-methyltransferase
VLDVVLFQPQIPPNTGNIGRVCAITRCRLHLIHPLGFKITDRHLKRSGMDYWHDLVVQEHADWTAFRAARQAARLFLFTTRGERSLWDVDFEPGDGLVFGNETAGAPPWLHEEIGALFRVRVPQFDPRLRSLNLSTCAGIVVYEALRQLHARGLVREGLAAAK